MITQQELNTFKRKYLKTNKKLIANAIIHDSNTVTEHRRLVSDICEWLRSNNILFYTKVYLKCGEIADIVVPELPRPIIEVRHSELEKNKKYNPEYEHLRVFIDTNNPWGIL
jgi:hypothetical protein